MNTLMPNLQDALSVHDAAHTCQDTELHNVALKLLALTGQVHIETDSLDYEAVIHGWGDLPGAICVEEESAAVFENEVGPVLVSRQTDWCEGLPAGVEVAADEFFTHKERTPAYSTWMVRMQEAEPVKPQSRLKVGEYVTVGSPRSHGAYRFPVVCMKVGDDYQMVQVHKDGDVVKVFGKDGKLVRGMAKLVDKFVNADYPRQGIYECVLCGDEVALWDVLFVDGMDCTPLPYQERVDLFMSAAQTGSYSGWDEILTDTELHRIGNKEALYNLTAGKWLVRHQDEVLSDSIIKPFWFVRDAGTVNIGTLLPWVTPAASVEDASGMIVVKQTGLPSMQIHKKGKSVNVYVAEGGRNRDTNLPQVVELARLLPEDFVMEAQWTCLENGVPVSAGRVQNPKSNLAECEIVLYPYDLLVYGDMNLIDKPMYERVDVLEKVVDELANERIVMGLDDEGGIAFDADSVRHLDGDCSHCFTVK